MLHVFRRAGVLRPSLVKGRLLHASSGPIPEVTEVFDAKHGVLTLTLNRPSKKNSLTSGMYERLTHILGEGGRGGDVTAVVLTGADGGTGPAYFSAGNDLMNFTGGQGRSVEDIAADAAVLLEAYVDAWITFPKLLLVAVNGPAIGIPVTTLPLADCVWASPSATFTTPFVALGQAPEACSSVTFPRLMGHHVAAEVLLLGRTLDAEEAVRCRLVGGILPAETLVSTVTNVATRASRLPRAALASSKRMLRIGMGQDNLRRANARECALLRERWASAECQAALLAFLSRKA